MEERKPVNIRATVRTLSTNVIIAPKNHGNFKAGSRGIPGLSGDFARLHTISQACAFFVIRAKSNLKCRRVYSNLVDRTTGLICDQSIMLTGFYQAKDYPDKLRRVKYYDAVPTKRWCF